MPTTEEVTAISTLVTARKTAKDAEIAGLNAYLAADQSSLSAKSLLDATVGTGETDGTILNQRLQQYVDTTVDRLAKLATYQAAVLALTAAQADLDAAVQQLITNETFV